MGHYTGPKARVNRRLKTTIYESNGCRKAADRHDAPPGMHTRPSKVSGYGLALAEKQKVKHYYGLSERQLRRLFAEAARRPGNTGENLLGLCESRLDNVIRRAGMTVTRPQARQGVGHGHFLLNGRKADVASILVKPGDVIYVKGIGSVQTLYRDIMAKGSEITAPFLSLDGPNLTIKVDRLPMPDEFSCPANVNLVVEFLSR